MKLTGRTLGKYTLVEYLGQGGMASVYRAVQPTIERQVAIKVLHDHLASSESFVERFKREARGLGQLQHPHIVHVIDFDLDDDYYYMVMDYVPGKTLSTYLQERGALPVDETLALMDQLADALAYAHRRGTIHRDIKPSNVLFRDEACREAVLTDFGIGRLVSDATMTMSGSVLGTPAYMSPEAVQGQRVDGRADIYSLGIVFYEMVTGRVPYTGDTPLSVIMKQVNEPLPPLSEIKPDLPDPVVAVIEKMLQKDVNQRFQSADELLDAMRSLPTGTLPAALSRDTVVVREPEAAAAAADATIAAGTPPVARSQTPPSADATPPALQAPGRESERSPHLMLFGLGSLAMLVLLALGFFALNGGDEDPVAELPTAPPAVATEAPAATEAPPPTELPAPAEPTATAVAEPAPLPTVAVTPTPEAAPPANQFGTLQFADNESLVAGDFSLFLERVPQPPAGTRYILWFRSPEGGTRNAGPLAIERGVIQARGSLQNPLIGPDSQVIISIEPEDVPAVVPGSRISYLGELPQGYSEKLRELLVAAPESSPLLVGGLEQARVAQDHVGFALESLAATDLAEAKRHTEHVVNILDGEDGLVFGDLDGDGQTQNPGDGFGVRRYLLAGRETISAALADVEMTEDRRYHADGAIAALDRAIEALNAAFDTAQRIIASDEVAEAQPLVSELQEQLNRLVDADESGEHVLAAYEHALALAAMPLLAQDSDLPAPAAVAETIPGRRGVLRFANNSDARAGDYVLQLSRIDTPPPGFRYDAWLVSEDGANTLRLGDVPLFNHNAVLSGRHAESLLASYDRMVISLEEADAVPQAPSRTLVYRGDLLGDAGTRILALLAAESDSGKGAVFGAEEQTLVAQQHRQFSEDSLAAGDLNEARRHAEHVINILDGADGVHYGDLDGDGQIQNPGDDIGVRGHLETTIAAMEQLPRDVSLTSDQLFYSKRVIANSRNSLAVTNDAIDQVLKVFAADTVEEARPFIDEATVLLDGLLNGSDSDGNGVADPLQGEGGITGINQLTLAINEVHVFPVETPAAMMFNRPLLLAPSEVSYAPGANPFICELHQTSS
jgi:serine/threonine-protein kinase